MTHQEFARIGTLLMDIWSDDKLRKPEVMAHYFEELHDFDAQAVAAVVRLYEREGREFAPTAGLLRKRIIELTLDAPEWAEVWAKLSRLVRSFGMGGHYDSPGFHGGRDRVGMALADNPMIDRFVKFVGGRRVVYDAVNEQHGEARLRDKWAAFLKREVEGELMVGLEAPSIPRIGRANAGAKHIGEVIQGALPEGDGEAA